MKKLNWAIIGAGQIAGGFDRPYDAKVLTHVKALKRSPYVDKDRISIVEPDDKRRKLFCKKWGISKCKKIPIMNGSLCYVIAAFLWVELLDYRFGESLFFQFFACFAARGCQRMPFVLHRITL